MKNLPASLSLLSLLLFVATPVIAQGMKPGLWEVKTIKQVVDGQDMTAQMAAAQAQMRQQMASMTPEQRKQLEAMMGGQGSAAGSGATRICISPEMAKREEPMLDPQGHCKPSKMSRSGNTTSFEFDCSTAQGRSIGKGKSTTTGSSIHSIMEMTTSGQRGTHTMQSESQMNYLGPDCQGLAPVGSFKR